MGRPWWYDNYWQKSKKPRRQINIPSRKTLVWIGVVVLSLLLAVSTTGFHITAISLIVDFVYYLCRILTFIVFMRAIFSWFTISRHNIFVLLLDDVTEPILSPLRRLIPRLGIFDITPLVAIAILFLIPFIITRFIK